MGVGFGAILVWTAAKGFCVGVELNVALDTDDGFVFRLEMRVCEKEKVQGGRDGGENTHIENAGRRRIGYACSTGFMRPPMGNRCRLCGENGSLYERISKKIDIRM